MNKFWKYGFIGLLTFLLGTATVLAAPEIKNIVIGSPDGARVAEVTVDGALMVDANLPAVQAVTGNVDVNNFPPVQQVGGTVSIDNFPNGGNLSPQLFTLLDDVEIPAGQTINTPYVNVDGFSRVKVFVTRNVDGLPGGYLSFSFHQSLDGVEDIGSHFNGMSLPNNGPEASAVQVLDFPPFLYVRASIRHIDEGYANLPSQRASVFLYAVP